MKPQGEALLPRGKLKSQHARGHILLLGAPVLDALCVSGYSLSVFTFYRWLLFNSKISMGLPFKSRFISALLASAFIVPLTIAKPISPHLQPNPPPLANLTNGDLHSRVLLKRASPSNLVFAHFMVGFTANYTIASWETGEI